ncbi:hypothetical protein LENED_007998 [Lentinula edodes]|uniref:F-box domain-containing protein n=1 Tax=Lentinula edodes TaxID=5353 RepID=A0A1Q3EFX7_LENED|nr:hypothetical protein LENED_007998 [Lentinula edodes]
MTSQSTSNPFDILPNELIIDIFILIRHESAFYMNPSDKWISSVVRLSSVSHRWRDIAITTPQFWTFFVLSTPNSIQLAPLFFERSKPLPIDLIILHLSSKDILPLSSPENSRIRSLDYRYESLREIVEITRSRSAVGLSRVEVPSHFEFLPQQEVATKLNAANIELVFVNDKDATKTIVHYDSEDEDEDEEDEENLDFDELSWSDDDNYDYDDYDDYDDHDDHDDHDDLFERFGLLEGSDINGWDE